MTLSGVATFSGVSYSAQDYTISKTLTISFPGGTMATYSIIVTKDAAPALGAGSLNSDNLIQSYSWSSNLAYTSSGLSFNVNEGKFNFLGNKIVYTLPFGYNKGNLTINLFTNVATTTLTSSTINFTKSGNYNYSTSAVGINTIHTITATAQNGATRIYTLEFQVATMPMINDNQITYISQTGSFTNPYYPVGNDIILSYSNSSSLINTTAFGFQFSISNNATVTITGATVGSTNLTSTNYYALITSTSNNFNIQVQVANGGAIRTYNVIKVPSFAENNINNVIPIDFLSGKVNTGIWSYGNFTKFGNTLWHRTNSLSIITNTGASFNLSRVGSFKIDGATYTGQNLNWANDHTLTIFDFQGNLAKTYTIKSFLEPNEAEAYNPNPNVVNNLGIKTMQFITDNYSGNATITSEFITINLPSDKAKNKLQIYTNLGDGSVLSLPGMLVSNNTYKDYNFSNPVPAVVYAANGTKLYYTITVNNTAPIVPPTPLSSVSGMSYFYTNGTSNYIQTGTITSTNYTSTGSNISLKLPYGTMQNNVSLYFPQNVLVSGYGAKSSGSNNYDLTTPLTVTSFAANGIDKTVYIKCSWHTSSKHKCRNVFLWILFYKYQRCCFKRKRIYNKLQIWP